MSIQLLARILHVITVMCLVLLPLLLAYLAVTTPISPETLSTRFPHLNISETLQPALLWTSVALMILPFAVLWFTLNQLRLLTRRTAKGLILTEQSAVHVTRIGCGLLVLAMLSVVLWPLQSILLTWNNPIGMRSVSLGLTRADIGFVLGGALLTLLGHAMRDAARAVDENRAFV